ncbi:MAG: alpha/beta hydrolase [Pseudomonadales bacterium]|nr:alpha/beta hydrolase [Pseudomonadales bacterium]
MSFEDVYYWNADGLTLYARDYHNPEATLTALCLPGLTRNSADFEDLCESLQPDFRVIAVDQRGRGKSDWARSPEHYTPATYVQDMFALIETLKLERIALIGTSLGGLMSMMMNAMQPGRFAGIVLNDIGPEVDPVGLERIRGYVGKVEAVDEWREAIEHTRAKQGAAFPDMPPAGWEKFARRTYARTEEGRLAPAYDPAISEPMNAAPAEAAAPDLWPVFDLMKDVPLMVVRGELTDILPVSCVEEMKKRKPDVEVVEVARVGHAPVLDEPGVMPAIHAFLKKLG